MKTKIILISLSILCTFLSDRLTLNAQTFEENIQIPTTSNGGSLTGDSQYAYGKVFTYATNGISIYDAATNIFQKKIQFEDFGKFNPVFHNARLYACDQKMMADNNKTNLSDPKYVFAITPGLNLLVINANNTDQYWIKPLIINAANEVLSDIPTSQNVKVKLQYDSGNDRLYLLVSGRDADHNCTGNFHEKTNIFCIYNIDNSYSPSHSSFLSFHASEINTPADDYGDQINNYVFNEANDLYYIVRLGIYDNNIPLSQSIIEIHKVIASGTEPVDTIPFENINGDKWFKMGKMLFINSQVCQKIIVFPYRYFIGVVPQPRFCVIDATPANPSIDFPDSPSRKVLDATFLEHMDGSSMVVDLLISYAPDNNEIYNAALNTNLAIFRYSESLDRFIKIKDYDTDFSTKTDDFDLNAAFHFTKINATTAMLSKKDAIVKVEYIGPPNEYSYTAEIVAENNFFYHGAVSSTQKVFINNLATNGIEIFNNSSHDSIQTAYPTHHITANADGSKLCLYNKLNTHNTGLHILTTATNSSFNLNTILPATNKLESAIGDCIYNPFQDHFLISKLEKNNAKILVINAVTNTFEQEFIISGAEYAKEMFVAPNGNLYIWANMHNDISTKPVLYIYDANNYNTQIYQSNDISLLNYNEDFRFYSAQFCYNPFNQKVYSTICIQDLKLTPYNSEISTIFNTRDSTPPPPPPGNLIIVQDEIISEYALAFMPGKLLCPGAESNNTLSQYHGKLFFAGTRLFVLNYSNPISNILTYDHHFIDIIYSQVHDTIFAIKEGTDPSCSEHRTFSIWKIYYNGEGVLTFEEFNNGMTYNGQVACLFENKYDGRIYIHRKIDEAKLGTSPMQLLSFNPADQTPAWDVISLEKYTTWPEYDHTVDLANFHYYSITTPYINPHNNSIYLPNGGHSCVSKLSFNANERVLLNEEDNLSWRWLSFPRLNRQNNNAVIVDNVLGGNHLYPNDYSEESKLLYYAYNDDPQAPSYTFQFNEYEDYIWDGTQGYLDDVQSTLGYKLKLIYQDPEAVWLFMEGTVFNASISNDLPTLHTRPNTNLEYFDNWVGYYLYQEQSPFDAISADDLEHIYAMRGQYWACAKFWSEGSPQPYWVCQCAKGHSERIKYGDMVVLKTYQEIEDFQWQQANQTNLGNIDRPPTQFFSFTEQSDYTPIFVELDSAVNPLEIGAFVEDSCVGATSVFPNDSIVLIQAYTEGVIGEIHFESHYGNKSMALPISDYLLTSNVQKKRIKRPIHTAETDDYYLVSFKDVQKQASTLQENQAVLRPFPNPVSSAAKIVFYTPSTEVIELSLYNIMGEKQQTLYSGMTNEGTHELAFSVEDINGGNLKNGTYILMLHSKNWQTQAKIVVLR